MRINRTSSGSSENDHLYPVPKRVPERPVAPDRQSQGKSPVVTGTRPNMQPPPALQAFLRSMYKNPMTLVRLTEIEGAPTAYVLGLIRQARMAGFRVFAQNNKPEPTTFEFFP